MIQRPTCPFENEKIKKGQEEDQHYNKINLS